MPVVWLVAAPAVCPALRRRSPCSSPPRWCRGRSCRSSRSGRSGSRRRTRSRAPWAGRTWPRGPGGGGPRGGQTDIQARHESVTIDRSWPTLQRASSSYSSSCRPRPHGPEAALSQQHGPPSLAVCVATHQVPLADDVRLVVGRGQHLGQQCHARVQAPRVCAQAAAVVAGRQAGTP